MNRLSSVDEFTALRQRVRAEAGARAVKPTLVLCAGTGGQASGSNDIMRVIKRTILERRLGDRIQLRITGCQGFCEMDPFIVVEPGHQLYPKLKMEDVPRVIDCALRGVVDEELIYREPHETKPYHRQDDIPFFKGQTRTLLGANQRLDPIRIENYLQEDGYRALEKVLLIRDPEWIIAEVKASGLRGRGGAGFPTGRKWELARAAGNGKPKFVVCNCDEGDPGAYMDRSLLEGNPHQIIEGLLIAGIAIGASRGIVYVRSEYPLAVKHTIIALRQARDLGLLGRNILGTGIDFDVEIVRGAGAFVCGEETALIQSVMGYMGVPSSGLLTPSSGASTTARPASTTWRPWPTCRSSSSTAPPSSRRWGCRGTRAPRSSRSWGRSGTPASSRSPSGSGSGTWSTTSAAGRRARRRSRRCRRAGLPGAASRPRSSTCPSTTTRSPRRARSWAPAA